MRSASPIAIAAALFLLGCGSSASSDQANDAALNWLSSEERGGRSRPAAPLIALNCPVGNAYRCDRLIFNFSMRLPAEHLDAWVAGRRVRGLRTAPLGGDGPGQGVSGLVWTGFVQPAGLTEPGGPIEIESSREDRWVGRPPVHARIRVVAKLKRGETVSEVFPSVDLLAGYG